MERMELVGLKHGPNELAVAVAIIRDWIRSRQGDITLPILEQILHDRELFLHASADPCITVHLNTIAEDGFDLEPDFKIDWRKYFEGRPELKGHQLKNPDNWNKKLLPELHAVLKDVRRTTPARFVRARGLARLSAWIALGHTFSEVAGFMIEVVQQDKVWRTDANPSDDFKMLVSSNNGVEGEALTGSGSTVACGISVSGSLDQDVRAHLATLTDLPAAVLLLRPNRELGRDCLRDAGDVVALARQSKDLARQFVKRWNATRLLFYYFGPLSGACFLGHQLNAVCREIQIMEDQQPGYAPAFLLT
jgi:SMODS-associated and fused to various effectors sensor domain